MKLHGLGRVSSAGEQLSVDRQHEAFDAFWESKERRNLYPDAEKGGWYEDINISGGLPFTRRKNFAELLRNSKSGDVIVVAKLDRFSRNCLDFYQSLQFFRDSGCGVFVLDLMQDICQATLHGKILINNMIGWAEFERDLIASRCNAAKQAIKEEGGFTGGVIPFGWKKKMKYSARLHQRIPYLVPCEKERGICRLAHEYYKKGYKYSQIAQEFSAQKIQIPRRGSGKTLSDHYKRTGRHIKNGFVPVHADLIKYWVFLVENDFPEPGTVSKRYNRTGKIKAAKPISSHALPQSETLSLWGLLCLQQPSLAGPRPLSAS